MKILFIDPECPAPLDGSDLGRVAIGGTESSLFRLAESLAAKGHWVAISQHNRFGEKTEANGVCYQGFVYRDRCPAADQPDVVVVLRNFKILPRVRQQYPNARLCLWMHCFPGSRWSKAGSVIRQTDTTIISVSKTLEEEMKKVLEKQIPAWQADCHTTTIYNPVNVHHPETSLTWNPHQLIYLSSPHKGLEEVLAKFRVLRIQFPHLTLALANPGYLLEKERSHEEGIRILGALPQEELHRHVAQSLAVFYPQTTFAETFGLIFAEANSLGTPVLAHDLGAAKEVLNKGGKGQVQDCHNPNIISKTLIEWMEGNLPQVSSSPDFQLPTITEKWENLFDSRAVTDTRSLVA